MSPTPNGLPAAAWNFYLLHHVPAGEGGNVVQILFGLPGAGWLQRIRWCIADGFNGKNLFELIVFVTLLAVLAALVWNIWRARADRAAVKPAYHWGVGTYCSLNDCWVLFTAS